ncbi:DNA topoisomerase 3-alpha-like [Oscarella lobularis]|uniref:DNA topoisomerase 3-alpha-like n=1 Tax=Oscarella lobularis TaxID=121494 RepID=UPI0033141901
MSGWKRILNVAEKNDAAKEISTILSRGSLRRRDGRSVYNKIYEFSYNIFGANCQMLMTSVSGHLLDIEFGPLNRKWYSCPPAALFTAAIQRICPQNFVAIKETLQELAPQCQVLILWTDCDREGEGIGFEIQEVCCAANPHLDIYRARFSEITGHSIHGASQNLGRLDRRIVDAVETRRELDLRIGAAFTRFQTMRLCKVFPADLADQLISYGSCQFPTLGFVVERHKQIENFISETFHKIKVTYQTNEGLTEFNWKRGRLFLQIACEVLHDRCMENSLATVVAKTSKHKSKWRPLPLDTVELEKLASRKLRINAKETMRIAEKLYTQGYISYPRTETNIFPLTLNLNEIIGKQTNDPNWGAFAAGILQQGGATPRRGSKTDNAHPPIHPTKYSAGLQGNEGRVYEFVVRHFLACCSKDAQGEETTVEIDIASERFTASGLSITVRNYLDVYPYDKWSEKTLPVFQQGQTFQPTSIEMIQGETSPPSLLHEADLIALMEKHGIGTDATHADHIETIKQRGYVGLLPDGGFVPGGLGMGLVDGYDSMGLQMSKPNLRAELEADLKSICEGRKQKRDVLDAMIAKYKDLFVRATAQCLKLDEALSEYFGDPQSVAENEGFAREHPVVRKCPSCKEADMTLRTKKDGGGFIIGCGHFPNCRASIFLPSSITRATVTEESCTQCQPGPVFKLRLTCRRGTLMDQYMQEDGTYLCCVFGCDESIRVALDIRTNLLRPRDSAPSLPTPSNRSTFSSSGYNSGTSSSSSSRQRRPPGGASGFRSEGNSGYSSASFASVAGSSQNLPVNCSCNVEAVRRTVRKDGPNCGREFFCCSKPQNSRCDFFLWADNAATTAPSHPPPPPPPPPPQSSNQVSCRCGQEAVKRTVRKQGPNCGREFFCCSKPQNSRCDFFLWVDDAAEASSGPMRQATQPFSSNPTTSVSCSCGQEAVRRTVRKEGPNCGRDFFGCSKPQGSSCNFFLWCDDAASSGGHQAPQIRQSNAPSNPGQVSCSCGNAAAKRTVRKTGPNQGREFFCCMTSPNGCDFFLWVDDAQDAGGGQTGRGGESFGSRGRGRDEGGRKRKCGNCHQYGHTRRKCPNI